MWLLVHGEAPDVSPPIAGAVTPFNTRYGSRVDGETAVTACEYTIDGGATWRPATLTGTMPAFTCATTGIAGHNGQVLRLNMRATSDGGTAQGTALQVTVDTLPPAGTITINGNAAFSRTTTVSLSLTATDASGLAETCISTVPSWAAWEPFVKTKAWTLPSGDGVKTVFAWFRDRVGNTTTTAVQDQIVLDSTAPGNPTAITSSSHGLETWSADRTVQIQWAGAADAGSGVSGYSLKWSRTPSTIPMRSRTPRERRRPPPRAAPGSRWGHSCPN